MKIGGGEEPRKDNGLTSFQVGGVIRVVRGVGAIGLIRVMRAMGVVGKVVICGGK